MAKFIKLHKITGSWRKSEYDVQSYVLEIVEQIVNVEDIRMIFRRAGDGRASVVLEGNPVDWQGTKIYPTFPVLEGFDKLKRLLGLHGVTFLDQDTGDCVEEDALEQQRIQDFMAQLEEVNKATPPKRPPAYMTKRDQEELLGVHIGDVLELAPGAQSFFGISGTCTVHDVRGVNVRLKREGKVSKWIPWPNLKARRFIMTSKHAPDWNHLREDEKKSLEEYYATVRIGDVFELSPDSKDLFGITGQCAVRAMKDDWLLLRQLQSTDSSWISWLDLVGYKLIISRRGQTRKEKQNGTAESAAEQTAV